MKPNNRPHFYKYFDYDGAFKTVDTGKIRLSSPRLFNDPFDMNMALKPEITPEKLKDLFLDDIQDCITTGRLPYWPRGIPDLAKRQLFEKLSKDKIQADQLREALGKVDLSLHFASRITEMRNLQDAFSSNFFIYCLTETPDDLLMWSHYAAQHRGAVIRFKTNIETDNIFRAAQPVIYSRTFVPFGTADEWKVFIKTGKHISSSDLLLRFINTKSEHWSYEREWRIAIPILENGNADYAFQSIETDGIDEVHFGLRMSAVEKQHLSQIVRERHPHAQLYQMEKSETEFKLEKYAIY